MLLLSLLLAAAADKPPAKADRDAMIQGARAVVAAVVEAGRANTRRATPLRGDALTDAYVRAAAAAASKLPATQSARAFALGVGVALDTSPMLRNNLVTRATWRRVETDAERSARLGALGQPTMHGRHDLAQHFAVSAALTAVGTARSAEAAGILKEVMDAEPGGSGFSFADLAADLSGIALAARVIEKPEATLAKLAKGFRVADFCHPPKGLKEDLSRADFEKGYGGVSDERFQKELEALRKKVQALPGLRSTDRRPGG